jgi:hypothetical protein
MTSHVLQASIGTPIEAGDCSGCSLLWFDGGSGTRLAPGAVLSLFQTIGGASSERPMLRSSFVCPRCTGRLAFTHDLQRTTHFTYWRCPSDHGQLIGFGQFLLEKNFVRAPSPEELAKLRLTVREISCSQCGAPINLQNDSACPYCHAAIAMIDPEGIAKAVRELAAAGHGPVAPVPATMSGAALDSAQLEAIFSLDRIDGSAGRHDLLAIGVGAISAMLSNWLA